MDDAEYERYKNSLHEGTYYEETGTVRIAVLDLSRYYGQGYIISRINVPFDCRGQGFGTKLLKRITDAADREGQILWLEIQESDGLTYDQLEAWYKRHGFKWYRGTMGVMRRLPNSPITHEVCDGS